MNCGNEQRGGNFCGNCGTPLGGEGVAVERAGRYGGSRYKQPNPIVDQTKEAIQGYFRYFNMYIREPSATFTHTTGEFSNGVATIVLFLVLAGIGCFTLQPNEQFFAFIGKFVGLSFVQVGIVLISLFTINSVFGSELTLKKVIGIYGTHLLLGLIMSGLSIIMIQFGSIDHGIILLSIAVIYYAILILPLYIVTKLLPLKTYAIDPLYVYMSYIIMVCVLTALFLRFAGNIIRTLPFY